MDELHRNLAIINNCDSLFGFPILQSPSEKGGYSKRKYFTPLGSLLFPLRADPFSESTALHFRLESSVGCGMGCGVGWGLGAVEVVLHISQFICII